MPLSLGIANGQSSGNGLEKFSELRKMQDPEMNKPSNKSLEDPGKPALSQKQVAYINGLRQKQMETDSARLLALATELKTDVDKTAKDTASPEVVRKAEEIEKLAHSVHEMMRASVLR